MSTITDRHRTDDEASSVTIRPARAEEMERARAVVEEARLFLGGFEEQFGPQFALAVAADGSIVGVAGIEIYGDVGLLRSVCVREAWRGKGIAARLVRDRLVWARARELRAIHLFTTRVAFWTAFDFEVSDPATWPAALHESVQFRLAEGRGVTAMVRPIDGRDAKSSGAEPGRG